MKSVPLVDSRIVAQAFAMRRVVQQPEVLEGNPVIKDAQSYGSVLRDRSGRWRMWYLAEPVYCGYYAESEDGLNWSFPDLDLVAPEVRGSLTGPNAFLCNNQRDVNGGCLVGTRGPEGFAVIDAEATPHPAAKARFTSLYLARTETEAGMYLAHSDDGIRWFAEESNPVIAGWRDTSSVLFYDDRIGSYVWYGRPKAFASTKTHANRVIARKESKDLVNWSPDCTVMDTDDADADSHDLLDETTLRLGKDTVSAAERVAVWAALTEGDRADGDGVMVRGRNRQWYGITAFPYADLYLGIAWMYDLPSGDMWTELVHSFDGIDWRREPIRVPFISRVPGTCTCTMASPPVTVGDEIRIYDSIANRTHHGVPNPDVEKGIRVVSLERDRWVGYESGDAEGELLTQTMERPDDLSLNVTTSVDGWVKVEVTDEEGTCLEGLTREESEPISGDGLELVPRWQSGKRIDDMPVERVRLRILARDASIFALNL